MKKNFFFLIPGKRDSKRVKNKNLRFINFFSLIEYTIGISLMCKIGKIFVSTNSKKILDLKKKYSNVFFFKRPEKLAKYNSSDTGYIFHFLDYLKKKNIEYPDYIIQMRPTTPFRDLNVLKKAIDKIIRSNNCTSLRSSSISDCPPEKMFRIKKSFYCSINNKKIFNDNFNLPSHNFDYAYIPNGYVDILKTKHLLKKKTIYGNKILPFITEPALDIDTEHDIEIARNYKSINKKKIISFLKKNQTLKKNE